MNSLISEFQTMLSFENVKWDAVVEATYETIYMTVIATLVSFIWFDFRYYFILIKQESDNSIQTTVWNDFLFS